MPRNVGFRSDLATHMISKIVSESWGLFQVSAIMQALSYISSVTVFDLIIAGNILQHVKFRVGSITPKTFPDWDGRM